MVVQPTVSCRTFARVSIVKKHYRDCDRKQRIADDGVCDQLMSKERVKSVYGKNADLVLDRVLRCWPPSHSHVGSLYNGDVVSILFRRAGAKKTSKGFSTRPAAARLAYAFANSDESEWKTIASSATRVRINDEALGCLMKAIAEEVDQVYQKNPDVNFHTMHLCDKWPVSDDGVTAKMQAIRS